MIASAISEFDTKPASLAEALKSYLGEDGIRTLVTLWGS